MELNNIYLGNAYELIKDIPDKSVDLIITDPPYDIQGIHGSGILKDRTKNVSFHEEIADKQLDIGLDLKILDEFIRVMKKTNIYIWCNKPMIMDYLKYFVDDKKLNYEILIWKKENPIPFCGTHYLVDKEYCLYFWEEGAPVHIPFNRGGTVFTTKKNIDDKKQYKHPTIKNLQIIETLVMNSSKEGQVVLDPFVGSGTTCVASKRLNRKYLGFEIDEEYFKIAQDRINGFNQNGQGNLFDL